jgi:hypothetical protein
MMPPSRPHLQRRGQAETERGSYGGAGGAEVEAGPRPPPPLVLRSAVCWSIVCDSPVV